MFNHFEFRCDMYLHVVDRKTQAIATIPDVLKVIDAKYDFLKDYYAGFAIENVIVSNHSLIIIVNSDFLYKCI